MTTQTLSLPSFEDALVVVPAPGTQPGNWSGAASAVLVDGVFWLTYRVRRPLVEAAGVSMVVARSEDGEHFVTVAEVRRDAFRAESLELPVLVRRPDGGWRLYVSCATPNSKHWWIEAVDADQPGDLEHGTRTVVLPGTDEFAVKDPVVLVDATGLRMWVCVHPLTEPGHEDQMTTAYASSDDGLTWDWHEATGVARSTDGRTLLAEGGPVIRSPHSDGALRYVAAVPLPAGGTRFYFEAARPDGAHDLMTSISR